LPPGRPAALAAAVGLLALAGGPATAARVPPGFVDQPVVNRLNRPTAMAFAPDGRLFICEQGGTLRIVKNGALLPTPFLELSVNSVGERGLLGVALHPSFATNGLLYVYHTVPGGPPHNRISQYTASGDVAVGGSATPTEGAGFDLDDLGHTNHNGGALHFGSDGKLYVAVGENAVRANAQTLGNLLGKILRLNDDLSIPSDNPFFAIATGRNRAIWALGLRNPFTFSVHPSTGRIFINDVGQSTWEEIDDGFVGANYGWPNSEGPNPPSPDIPGMVFPLYFYDHSHGCAITGGTFVDPSRFPADFDGDYLFSDVCGGWIRRYHIVADTASDFATGVPAPVDLAFGANGALYYLGRGGETPTSGFVRRIVNTASQAPVIVTDPRSRRILEGDAVSFKVVAAGTAPLAYQWRRNGIDIPGATTATYALSPVQLGDDQAGFSCHVQNGFGAADSLEAILTVAPNAPPTAQVLTPAATQLYGGGQLVRYSGSGTDAEDGPLPASAFTWQVDFHHDGIVDSFLPPTTGARRGSFTVPTRGVTSANVWFRIHLTAQDRFGKTDHVFRDLLPRKVDVTLQTFPPGLLITLDGQIAAAPLTFTGVVGIQRSIGAAEPQTFRGLTLDFWRWSDGGAATHDVTTPPVATTYTATYVKRPTGP
jgi:glucose/arabinose dehydrogenase